MKIKSEVDKSWTAAAGGQRARQREVNESVSEGDVTFHAAGVSGGRSRCQDAGLSREIKK